MRSVTALKTGRAIVIAVLATAVTFASAGCSHKARSTSMTAAQTADELKKPTTLTFWSWVKGIDEAVALFERKYPNIKVKVVDANAGAGMYSALRSAITAGTDIPDVAQIEYQQIPAFTTTGDLLDLTPYGAGVLKDKFVDWTWAQAAPGGHVYAIPQDTGPMGMLYRQDIFAQYDIAVPTTWEEFAAAARKLHAADPTRYLANLSAGDGGCFMGMAWQAGSHPFTTNGRTLKIALNDAGANKVAEFWTPLIKDGVISVEKSYTGPWFQGLESGQYATWISAAWAPLTILDSEARGTAGKWRVAPLPQWKAGEHASGNWGGSTTAVLQQSKHRVAAAAFAKFLNTDPESIKILADKLFLFPATTTLLNDPAFRDRTIDFYGGQTANQVFADISATVPTDFAWSPFQDFVYSSFSDTTGQAIANRDDLSRSLNGLQEIVTEYARQQGFTVD